MYECSTRDVYTAVCLLASPRRGKTLRRICYMQCHQNIDCVHINFRKWETPALQNVNEWKWQLSRSQWHLCAVFQTNSKHSSVDSHDNTSQNPQKSAVFYSSFRIHVLRQRYLYAPSHLSISVCRRYRQNSGLVAEDLTREEGDSSAPNMKLTQTALWTTQQIMTNLP